MLAALLLDLGDTLETSGRVIAHVPEALAALSRLTTASGAPLALALVSNDTRPGEPADHAQFEAYVELVRELDLLRFFEPVDVHVTTSSLIGVTKPAPEIFALALTRLGLAADLTTAMFITEEATHVAAARELGMTAWQYRKDFTDWSEVPDLVARAIRHAQRFEAMLHDTGAVAAEGEALAPGQTHELARGPDGTPRPKRKRFSIT